MDNASIYILTHHSTTKSFNTDSFSIKLCNFYACRCHMKFLADEQLAENIHFEFADNDVSNRFHILILMLGSLYLIFFMIAGFDKKE